MLATMYLAEEEEKERIRTEEATALEAMRLMQEQEYAAEMERLRCEAEKSKLENNCSLVIQQFWRCYAARNILMQLRDCKAKHDIERAKIAAICIQCAWRQKVAKRAVLIERVRKREVERVQREEASCIIQCAWRCMISRGTLKHMKAEKELMLAKAMAEARRVQEEKERQLLAELMAMAVKPRFQAALSAGKVAIAEDAAACVLQSFRRRVLAKRVLSRKQFQKAEEDRLEAERVALAEASRKALAEASRKALAACMIQCSWRCKIATSRMARLREQMLERKKREEQALAAAAAKARRLEKQKEKQIMASLMAMRGKRRFHAAMKLGKIDIAKSAAACMFQCAWRCRRSRLEVKELKVLNMEWTNMRNEDALGAALEALSRWIQEEKERQLLAELMAMAVKPRFQAALSAGKVAIAEDAAACVLQSFRRRVLAKRVLSRKQFQKAEEDRLEAERVALAEAAAEAERIRDLSERDFNTGLKAFNDGDSSGAVVCCLLIIV